VKYLPPFELIRNAIGTSTVKGELRVNLSYDNFVNILRRMIAGIEVDEAWYLRTYEDIASAIKGGLVSSAKQHFVDDGYFEGRRPFAMSIDERWYLTQNADVAAGIRKGDIPSAQEHFDRSGYQEGRLPFAM
jgi:hypothetical protein